MAKHENCVCCTVNLPHYTDCNMATDMLCSDKILATWKAYVWHLTQLMCKLVAMLCSQFATLSCLHYGNRHSVFTFYLPQEYTIHVATNTVDVQISCHPVQLVAETAVTTDLLHFTIHTVWQLSQSFRKFSCHNEKACLWLLSQ